MPTDPVNVHTRERDQRCVCGHPDSKHDVSERKCFVERCGCPFYHRASQDKEPVTVDETIITWR